MDTDMPQPPRDGWADNEAGRFEWRMAAAAYVSVILQRLVLDLTARRGNWSFFFRPAPPLPTGEGSDAVILELLFAARNQLDALITSFGGRPHR